MMMALGGAAAEAEARISVVALAAGDVFCF